MLTYIPSILKVNTSYIIYIKYAANMKFKLALGCHFLRDNLAVKRRAVSCSYNIISLLFFPHSANFSILIYLNDDEVYYIKRLEKCKY